MKQFLVNQFESAASLLKHDYDVDKLRKLASESLRNIEGFEELVQMPAWKQLRKWVMGEVAILDNSIINLCDNPIKNEKEIVWKKARRTELLHFFKDVDEGLGQRNRVEQILKECRETTKLARPVM